MTSLLAALASTAPAHGCVIERVVPGSSWLFVCVRHPDGELRGGLAMTDPSCCGEATAGGSVVTASLPEPGAAAGEWVARLLCSQPGQAAAGLATLNAVLRPDPQRLLELDAADWLAREAAGKRVVVVGRFPFLDAEVRPRCISLDVVELEPRPGERGYDEIDEVLPQADVVALTSSSIGNRTVDEVLALKRAGARLLLLGPSTPLTPVVFDFGVDLASGVEVQDCEAVAAGVAAGLGFRRLRGLRRVSLAPLRARTSAAAGTRPELPD